MANMMNDASKVNGFWYCSTGFKEAIVVVDRSGVSSADVWRVRCQCLLSSTAHVLSSILAERQRLRDEHHNDIMEGPTLDLFDYWW